MSTTQSTATDFSGFAPDAMTFFVELSENQNKEWMADNKKRYRRSVQEPLGNLVVALTDHFAAEGIPLRGDPKRSLFRINRDVRFSADKRPYNDHASAALTREVDRQAAGVLYMQFQPKASFVAAGFFRPDPPVLASLRQGVAADPKRWKGMTELLAAARFKLGQDDTLIRIPKGFEGCPAEIEQDLKLKSWTIMQPLSPDEISSPALVDCVAKFARDALPLLEFGWSALAKFPPGPASSARR